MADSLEVLGKERNTPTVLTIVPALCIIFEKKRVAMTERINWSRDELILALAFYKKWNGNPPGKDTEEVAQLSELLNLMGKSLHGTAEEFRNRNGVYMKAMNFRRFDPVFIEQGKVGLQRGNKLEEVVWNDFAGEPELLFRTADAIRVATTNDTTDLEAASEVSDSENSEAKEGRILSRLHSYRERSRKLVEKKKQAVLKATQKLVCEVCSFDFGKAYGERGEGFIEAHHTKPLHTLVAETVTRLEDLVLLCSNCHRMIHASQPWLTVDDLRNLMSAEITRANVAKGN